MADRLTAKLVGGKALRKELARLDPSTTRAILDPSLTESMLLALSIAQREKIHAGGTGPPRANILTSRTGMLRRSLASDRAIDRSGLGRGFIEGGTALVYGAVHEFRNSGQRAFLSPGLVDAELKFPAIIEKHWARVVAQ